MHEDPPTPFDTVGDEPVEARIVAWVLGEASTFEAAELERLCEERPELLVFRRRMRALHRLLTESEASEPDHSWKLPPERRKVLAEILGEEKVAILDLQQEKRIRSSARRTLLAIAACLIVTVIVIGLSAPMTHRQRKRADGATMESRSDIMASNTGSEAPGRSLEKAIREQEDKVEERRKALATITRTKGIIHKGQDSFYGQSGVDEDQGARSALETHDQLQRDKKQLESQINSMLMYDSDQLMTYAAGMDLPDNAIRNLQPQYLEAKRKLEELKTKGEGDGGQTAAVAEEQVRAMKKQIDEGAADLRAALQEKLNTTQESLKSVEAMKDDTREEAIKRGLNAQDYADARREFESDVWVLRELKLKQAGLPNSAKAPEQDLAKDSDARSRQRGSAPAQQPAPAAAPAGQTASTGPEDSLAGNLGLDARPRVVPPAEPQAAVMAGGKLESAAVRDSGELADSPSSTATDGQASGGGWGAAGSFGVADAAPTAGPAAELAMKLGGKDSASKERERAAADKDIASRKADSAQSNRHFANAADGAESSVGGVAGEADGFASNEEFKERRGSDLAGNRNNVDAILNNPNQPETAGMARSSKSESGGRPPVLPAKKAVVPHGQPGRTGGGSRESGSFGGGLDNSAAPRGLEQTEAAKSDYYRAAYDHTRAELLSQVDSAWELTVPADAPASEGKNEEAADLTERRQKLAGLRKQLEDPAFADSKKQTLFKEWQKLKEKIAEATDEAPLAEPEQAPAKLTDLIEEIPASENPYSTFSLNISDASFQLAKAALAKGDRPDPAGIKPEQFYNAVDYGDPAPTSNEPVAATIEQSAHPVIPGRNLVRVALRTGSAGRSAAQPLRLTLLVDQSGSMVRDDRRASMEHALAQLGVLLTKNDLVTVIGFSRTPHLLAEGKAADGTLKLAELVNQTASEGGTNLEEAVKLGGQLAERHQLAGAQNRIVLFTDGAANLGDANPARLAEQVKSFRQKGLAFDIAGIGADGLNDRLLSELARNGNGRYYVVGDEKNDSFARQLAGAFRPAAENVKVQVNFNPQRVGKYKLIGFEKDRLKTEDFRNDAVDAAELAAEEAGVAIYQVEPLAECSGELGEVSVRFRDAASKEMVERTWTISYDAQATAFDRATPSMQLAGLSLLAAEKLKGGPLADAINFQQLAGSSALVKQFYGNSPRVADMLRVIDALK
jgi:Domain of unknown function (DUF3520)/von Willebrand factor type A domain/von Willebrand factor